MAVRLFAAVLIGVVLLSPTSPSPERNRLPTISPEAVALREVRRGPEMGVAVEPGDGREALFVERPFDAREGALAGVFVLDAVSGELRRVAVRYGRSSTSLIQIVSGASAGDRIVVSDMRAWDQFEGLRLRAP